MEVVAESLKKVQSNVEKILSVGSMRILKATEQDQSLAITALAEEISKELDVGYNFTYGIIGAYIEANETLICAKGKGMGIMLKSKYDAIQQKQATAKEEKTFSKFTVTIREIGMTKEQFEAAKRALHTESPSLASLKGWFAARDSK